MLQAGFQYYVAKPVDAQTLVSVVAALASNGCSRPADASSGMRGTSCSSWPKVT